MFKIDPEPTFMHTVKVKVPVNGGFTDQSFRVTFRVVPTDEAAEFALSDPTGSTDFLRRAVIRFDDLVDVNDQPVEHSDAVRDQLLRLGYLRQAVARTYFDAISGAKSGN